MPKPKPNTALTVAGPADTPGKAQLKAVRNLMALMEEIAACRAEMLRKETAAQDLETRLRGDLTTLEGQWVDLRVQTFRVLGRHLRDGWLNRKGQALLRRALASLADELESEYGVDLRADRRIFLGEEEADPVEEESFYSGRKRPAGGASQQARDPDDEFIEGYEFEFDAKESGSARSGHDDAAPGSRPAGKRGPSRSRPGSKASQRRAEKDQALSGDIRALYLLLARALHPDKEPNPALHEAKTVWMQKVTQAYAKRDLAMLLDILARNPLEAVGPYLAEAPLKTVQGFAKRLRKELALLKTQAAKAGEWLHPYFARFLKNGSVDEGAIARHLGELKRTIRLAKQRRDAYSSQGGVQGLVEALQQHSWRDLM